MGFSSKRLWLVYVESHTVKFREHSYICLYTITLNLQQTPPPQAPPPHQLTDREKGMDEPYRDTECLMSAFHKIDLLMDFAALTVAPLDEGTVLVYCCPSTFYLTSPPSQTKCTVYTRTDSGWLCGEGVGWGGGGGV